MQTKLANKLFDNDLNVKELDGRKCVRCFKIPPIKEIKKKSNEKGIYRTFVDRSSRIDCDAGGKGVSRLVTYCKECWIEEVNE